MKVLFFVYVWPEPKSSAAGVRTLELCENLRSLGHAVKLVSPCKQNAASAYLQSQGFEIASCAANDSAAFQGLKSKPELVFFDRFVMEEQFGWRVRETWPEATQVIDTQDLHTLRRARERLLQAGASPEAILSLEGANFSQDFDRELASFFRADAVLVVSRFEQSWLLQQGFPENRLFYLPFGAPRESQIPGFAERSGFCFLGNLRHPPNLDALRWIKESIWPLIRERLPKAELTIVGAYPPQLVSEWQGKNGISLRAHQENHRSTLLASRVMLAPLRYGAGIKGKVLEAWACGLPVAASPVALEGIGEHGFSTATELAQEALALHEIEAKWQAASSQTEQQISPFQPEKLWEVLKNILGKINALESRQHPFSRMLRQQNAQASKYFSLWIEEKNSKA